MTAALLASLVFIEKLLEMVGGAVLKGVGGITDTGLKSAAVVVVGGATAVVLGRAVTLEIGGAAVDSVMGGAADSLMGRAPDVLAVAEEISLTVDVTVDVTGKESSIKVGGAAVDTTEESKVVAESTMEVDVATADVLKVGGATVFSTEVGGALVIRMFGILTGIVVVTDGAKNVTEDLMVVAGIMGVAVEITGVAKVDAEPDKIDLASSDKTGVATEELLSVGGLVKVSSCSSSDGSFSSPLVSSSLLCPLEGFVRLSDMLEPLVLVELNEESKLIGLALEVVTAILNKLDSDLDEKPLAGGAVLSTGLAKLVSDFENRLLPPIENLSLLFADSLKVREL